MRFIETRVFTYAIERLLGDDEYREMQWILANNPELGRLISGGNGLRKLRWISRSRQKGKRGGIRVIYYIQSSENIYMIFAYGKNKQDDLTPSQLKTLKAYVRGGVL